MDADEIIKKHNKGGWVLLEIFISFEETGRIKFFGSPSYTVREKGTLQSKRYLIRVL